jgi:hypothetical protein
MRKAFGFPPFLTSILRFMIQQSVEYQSCKYEDSLLFGITLSPHLISRNRITNQELSKLVPHSNESQATSVPHEISCIQSLMKLFKA